MKKTTKTTSKLPRHTLRWSDFCRSLYALGLIENFSKGQVWKARKLLFTKGRVQQIARGRYALVQPESGWGLSH